MLKLRVVGVVLAFVLFADSCLAADDTPPLLIAKGTIEKVEQDSLTVLPRDSGGKFGKSLTLKVTGTSKISTLTTRKQGSKVVHVQRDTDAKDLQTKQDVAIIYTTGPTGMVLLAAVAQPAVRN
jgi:hypothetical protein